MPHKQWQIIKTGNLRHLRMFEAKSTHLAKNQVRVETRAIGLNFADIFACIGLYSATPPVPFVPGLEFSGIVTESKSSSYKKGQKVMGMTRFGAYNKEVVVDASQLSKLPASWSFEEGAAFLVTHVTALYALENLGNLKRGQLVFVHSAAGGVGQAAINLCQKLGANMVLSVGRQEKARYLVEQGFDSRQVIVRQKKQFARQLDSSLQFHKATGFNLALDSILSSYFYPLLKRLSPEGRHIVFGSSGYMPRRGLNYFRLALPYLFRPRVDPLDLVSQNKHLMCFNLIWLTENKKLFQQLVTRLSTMKLSAPRVDRIFAFADLPKALAYFQRGVNIGKVVVKI